MTNMMEKPQSKKAKTYSRFYGKQDHGDAAARKGRVEKKPDYGYWEQKFDERSAVNMAKTILKQDLHGESGALDDIRDDNFALDMAKQDKKMAEAWAEQIDDEFDDEMEYSSTTGDIYAEDGMGHTEYLKFLNNKLEELRSELESVPHLDQNDPDHTSNDQARLQLEAELLEVVAEIRELLNQNDFPEAAYGVASKREIRNRMARAATLDDYSEDDFGDTEQESAIHVRKIR
ncbi:MAG: hypothetical protein QG549_229 [Patescibacteria group bacterium]|nr:hypothetical protein [Patescibacteria group bacterium]